MHAVNRKRRRREHQSASPDLTPMIDVTFQLLIFFILCTRFTVQERAFQADLPLEEGFRQRSSPPKEQLTIYCNWDPQRQTNDYFLAIGARARRPVLGTTAGLAEMVVLGNDNRALWLEKKARYAKVNDALLRGMQDYLVSSGAHIEKLEISFARDAATGASSGTAPWIFVSAALDAARRLNQQRQKAGQEPLPLTFKFVDAQGRFSRH